MQRWQLQQAKARMSELVKNAQTQPQDITVHGKSVAVVLSRDAYDRLAGTDETLVEFMRRSPLFGDEGLKIAREQSATREVDL